MDEGPASVLRRKGYSPGWHRREEGQDHMWESRYAEFACCGVCEDRWQVWCDAGTLLYPIYMLRSG